MAGQQSNNYSTGDDDYISEFNANFDAALMPFDASSAIFPAYGANPTACPSDSLVQPLTNMVFDYSSSIIADPSITTCEAAPQTGINIWDSWLASPYPCEPSQCPDLDLPMNMFGGEMNFRGRGVANPADEMPNSNWVDMLDTTLSYAAAKSGPLPVTYELPR